MGYMRAAVVSMVSAAVLGSSAGIASADVVRAPSVQISVAGSEVTLHAQGNKVSEMCDPYIVTREVESELKSGIESDDSDQIWRAMSKGRVWGGGDSGHSKAFPASEARSFVIDPMPDGEYTALVGCGTRFESNFDSYTMKRFSVGQSTAIGSLGSLLGGFGSSVG